MEQVEERCKDQEKSTERIGTRTGTSTKVTSTVEGEEEEHKQNKAVEKYEVEHTDGNEVVISSCDVLVGRAYRRESRAIMSSFREPSSMVGVRERYSSVKVGDCERGRTREDVACDTWDKTPQSSTGPVTGAVDPGLNPTRPLTR